jgi:lipoprotein-anchoring transpeptidase ErfK/SrfK
MRSIRSPSAPGGAGSTVTRVAARAVRMAHCCSPGVSASARIWVTPGMGSVRFAPLPGSRAVPTTSPRPSEPARSVRRRAVVAGGLVVAVAGAAALLVSLRGGGDLVGGLAATSEKATDTVVSRVDGVEVATAGEDVRVESEAARQAEEVARAAEEAERRVQAEREAAQKEAEAARQAEEAARAADEAERREQEERVAEEAERREQEERAAAERLANLVAAQERLRELGYLVGAADGQQGQQTTAAIMAFQAVNGLTVDGVLGPQTLTTLDAPNASPSLRGGPGTRIEVDMDRQVLHLVEGGSRVTTMKVSTGRGGTFQSQDGQTLRAETPVGAFTIDRRIAGEKPSSYGIGSMWDPMYFYGPWAIHGSPNVPIGPASSGCVRISMADGRWLFDRAPNGTPVVLYGGRHVFTP